MEKKKKQKSLKKFIHEKYMRFGMRLNVKLIESSDDNHDKNNKI